MKNETQPMRSVLSHYGLENPQLESIGTGLINHTWRVSQGDDRFILQQVNPMFPLEVHEDINVITSYFQKLGLTISRLIPTVNGKLYYRERNTTWRLYTYIDGVTYNTASDSNIAYQAGILLGQFHLALMELDYQFKHTRAGVHDTDRHINNLAQAIEQKQHHPRYRDILPLATEILEIAERLPRLKDTEQKKVHGDPKINNFLFDPQTGNGICMLDFDTLSYMQLPLELGDAMRSWCNPAGENNTDAFFSIENFSAALDGYYSMTKNRLDRTEKCSILPATNIIYIELAARFCADALNEDYFAWDPEHFASHSEHSEIRAISQLTSYKSLQAQLSDVERIIKNTI